MVLAVLPSKNILYSSFQSVVISGAKSSEEAAFPKEAVKAYHDKPMPTHDKASSAHSKPKIIQQPKK